MLALGRAPLLAFPQLRFGPAPAQLRQRGLQNLPQQPPRSRSRRRAALEPRREGKESESSESYGLVDLVALSVASTVGSGVFSLAGRVASQEAGPAVPRLFKKHFQAPYNEVRARETNHFLLLVYCNTVV